MLKSTLKGLCFGLTSGIITTLGLIVGLHSFAGSRMVIIGGILTIAIADSFSDALGIHISEEAEENKSEKAIWISTIATFISKLVFSSTFIIPVMIFDSSIAIYASVLWGMLVLGLLSFWMARDQKKSPISVVGEHLFIAIVVIILTHLVGEWIAKVFV